MPIFKCSSCGCVDNTALTRYWIRKKDDPKLCSECDPAIGKWHDKFPKRLAIVVGYKLGADGFLYHSDEKPSHTDIIGDA